MYAESGNGGKRPMQRIIEVCLLVLLCGPDCDHCHGYALGERLREFGFDDSEISVSTLYRTLRGMEDAGWVTSDWAAGGPGPQRREYAVTDAGRAALDGWAAVLTKRRERITQVLDAYALLGREPAEGFQEQELFARVRRGGTGNRPHHRHGVHKPMPDEPQAETQTNAEPQREESDAAQTAGRTTALQKEAENLNEYWD